MMPSSGGTLVKGFTQVPNWILDDPQINPRDKIVLVALYRSAYRGKRRANLSQKALAGRLGMTRETVRFALTSLKEQKLIRPASKTGRGKKTAYDLLADPKEGQQFASASDGRTVSHLSETPSSHGGASATNNTVQEPKNNVPVFDSDCSVTHEREADAGHRAAPWTPAFEAQAVAAAKELGLDVRCPDDIEQASYEITECVWLDAGGELFNPGVLEALIAEYGIIRCWTQAKILKERLRRSKEPVRKITPYYMACVRQNAGRPTGSVRVDTAEFDDIPF